jgi:hypothetical protein
MQESEADVVSLGPGGAMMGSITPVRPAINGVITIHTKLRIT